jgi:hypothetical protein
MAEQDFGDLLTKEVKGVPVWAIAASAAAIIIGGAFWWNSRQEAAPGRTVYSPDDLQPEETDPSNADYGLPEGPIGDFLRENPGYAGYPVGGSGSGLPSPITNEQWGRVVSDRLLGEGADPSIVVNAVRKYLLGQALNASEKAVINQILTRFGAPPEGVLPIVDTPVPPPAGGGGGSGPVYVNVAKDFVWKDFINWVWSRTTLDPEHKLTFTAIYLLNPMWLANTYVDRYGVRRVKKAGKVRIK